MTILLLTHSYPDEVNKWRGSFIRDQAEAISAHHKVIVVYFRSDNSRFSPFAKYTFTRNVNGNIEVYSVVSSRSFPVINQVKYLNDSYRFIRDEIAARENIDIIHSHLSYPAGFLGVFAGKLLKVPVVITEHSWLTNHFRSFIHKECVLYAVRKADSVITVSNALKENITSYCKRPVEVIPNVVDTCKFHIVPRIKNDEVNIGLLGGMGTRIKGTDVLLNAVALINDPGLKVHIGGAGKYLDEYKELAKNLGIDEKVTFYGEITSDKKSDFYSKLDIYVMASHRETFGVVIVEALASGLPVIATKCGGPEEIVNSSNGVLTERNDPQALADAIINISGRLQEFDKLKIRANAIALYGTESFVSRLNSVYLDLTNKITESAPGL